MSTAIEYMKILAVVMVKQGLTTIRFTRADIEDAERQYANGGFEFLRGPRGEGYILRLVDKPVADPAGDAGWRKNVGYVKSAGSEEYFPRYVDPAGITTPQILNAVGMWEVFNKERPPKGPGFKSKMEAVAAVNAPTCPMPPGARI